MYFLLLSSCHAVRKVKFVKNENHPKGEMLFNVTYYSTIKKKFNQKEYERSYFVHCGDSVYQLKNVVFTPPSPDTLLTRNSLVNWYRSNQPTIQVDAEIGVLEDESYELYKEKLAVNRKRIRGDKNDRENAFQTHFFVDEISIVDNVLTIQDKSIEKTELTALGKGQDLIVISVILAGAALVIGFLFALVLSLFGG